MHAPRTSQALRGRLIALVMLVLTAGLAGCVMAPPAPAPRTVPARDTPPQHDKPTRFTIRPDDYHVPYAGTAADGRKFFLSDELFELGSRDGTAYVGLFLCNADGTFDEVRVDVVERPADVPPGQAAPVDAHEIVAARLAELGAYELEPITVAPFTTTVGGVVFGWNVSQYDGIWSINIEPGDFIAYYWPWDGVDYDT